MGRSWRARCDRRRVLPPECQRRHQLGASGDRASPPHGSRSPRHRPGHAARASRPPTRSTTASAFTGCRRGCSRRSRRCRWACHGRGWSACCADSTPTSCIWPRRRCSATAGCTPRGTSVSRPSPYSKPTSRVSRRATASASRPGPRGRGPGTCTTAPTARWRRPPRRWKTLSAHRIPRVHKWARGVDITGFAPSARDERLRPAWSPDGKPIVGFVGRLAPEKHVERLAALAARNDLQLVIVGDGVDRQKLESLLPTAVFTGALYGEELAAAYASMDVFVHPGEHETFCQAVQEAMASGLPVIAPNVGGPRDLVAPVPHRAAAAGRRIRGQARRIRRPLDRRTAPLLGGGPPQRVEPDLAGDLRRAARPLRGGHRPPPPQGRLTFSGEQSAKYLSLGASSTSASLAHRLAQRNLSPGPAPRPAATPPMS